MAPRDVAHVPRTPSPVAEAGPVAKHFRSRARLCRLLVRLRRPTPSTPALRATPGGASLSTFGFVTIVPRYLLKASNFLTFVRGACRAYRASHKVVMPHGRLGVRRFISAFKSHASLIFDFASKTRTGMVPGGTALLSAKTGMVPGG